MMLRVLHPSTVVQHVYLCSWAYHSGLLVVQFYNPRYVRQAGEIYFSASPTGTYVGIYKKVRKNDKKNDKTFGKRSQERDTMSTSVAECTCSRGHIIPACLLLVGVLASPPRVRQSVTSFSLMVKILPAFRLWLWGNRISRLLKDSGSPVEKFMAGWLYSRYTRD
jgi:hypothetical protein